MTSEEARTNSPLSVASIVASMTAVALGNGVMSAYVPFVLSRSDSPSWAAGGAVTAVAFGGLLGCVVAGPLACSNGID